MEYFKIEASNGRRYHTLHRYAPGQNQTACGIMVSRVFEGEGATRIWYVTTNIEGHRMCASTCFRPRWHEGKDFATQD